MSNLVPYERALEPMMPAYAELMEPMGLNPARLKRTALIAVDRVPRLRECSMDSFVQAVTTCAVLGLDVDGVTGQAFILPFRGRAQPIIGYKGFNTIGARAGFTIAGGVVRDGDTFEYEAGTSPFLRHRPLLTTGKRDILAAYAVAKKPGAADMVAVVMRDELMAIKSRAPGGGKSDSPWNDPAIGFPAMCEKTAKRRLARSMPVDSSTQYQQAAALDSQIDIGRHAYLSAEGRLYGHEAELPDAPRIVDAEPVIEPAEYVLEMIDGSTRTYPTLDTYLKAWDRLMQSVATATLAKYKQANASRMADYAGYHADEMTALDDRLRDALQSDPH